MRRPTIKEIKYCVKFLFFSTKYIFTMDFWRYMKKQHVQKIQIRHIAAETEEGDKGFSSDAGHRPWLIGFVGVKGSPNVRYERGGEIEAFTDGPIIPRFVLTTRKWKVIKKESKRLMFTDKEESIGYEQDASEVRTS